jgi:cell division protein ZapA
VSDVRIAVGPRKYAIACAPEDADKVRRLGEVIDAHYAKLGPMRAAQEADNLVLAALFLADELDEARTQAREADVALGEARSEAEQACNDAANAQRRAETRLREAREKSGNGRAELHAEIETLRKAEEHARRENARLKSEIAELKEAARHQHDLFGGPGESEAHSDALAETLEKLALRAEAAAKALEGRR